MTDRETEIMTLLHALGEAIRTKKWPDALPIWEQLLSMYSPLAEWHPHVATVLRNEAAMVHIAEHYSTKVH